MNWEGRRPHGPLVSQTDPSSPRFRLLSAFQEFAVTSRRNKPGWNRGIRHSEAEGWRPQAEVKTPFPLPPLSDFRLRVAPVFTKLRRGKAARQGGFWYQGIGVEKGIGTLPVPEKNRGRTGVALANLRNRKRITKKAHAGRGQETKWEMSIQSSFPITANLKISVWAAA